MNRRLLLIICRINLCNVNWFSGYKVLYKYNKMATYEEVREKLAERDMLMIDDPYFNTLPPKQREIIEVRHANYIMENEDDEATKTLVLEMMKPKRKTRKSNN